MAFDRHARAEAHADALAAAARRDPHEIDRSYRHAPRRSWASSVLGVLLTIFRPFAQLRIGILSFSIAVAIALFTWAYAHPHAALVVIAIPLAWLVFAFVWWHLYAIWLRLELRRIGYRRVDIPIGKDLLGNSRWDLTGGSRAFPGHIDPHTPTFAFTGGHAVAVGAPGRDGKHKAMPQVGAWATSIRMVDVRPWYRRMTIHPRWWTHVLLFVHVRMDHDMPGYIFRDRHLVDFGGSQALDLESIDLSRARRFVLDRGEAPVDVAYAFEPPTIEWLLRHPHLEFEAYGKDLVLFDSRGPMRARSLTELLDIADALRARIDHPTVA